MSERSDAVASERVYPAVAKTEAIGPESDAGRQFQRAFTSGKIVDSPSTWPWVSSRRRTQFRFVVRRYRFTTDTPSGKLSPPLPLIVPVYPAVEAGTPFTYRYAPTSPSPSWKARGGLKGAP